MGKYIADLYNLCYHCSAFKRHEKVNRMKARFCKEIIKKIAENIIFDICRLNVYSKIVKRSPKLE